MATVVSETVAVPRSGSGVAVPATGDRIEYTGDWAKQQQPPQAKPSDSVEVRAFYREMDADYWLPISDVNKMLDISNDRLLVVKSYEYEDVYEAFSAKFPAKSPGCTRLKIEVDYDAKYRKPSEGRGSYYLLAKRVDVRDVSAEVYHPLQERTHYHHKEYISFDADIDAICAAAKVADEHYVELKVPDRERHGYVDSGEIGRWINLTDSDRMASHDCYVRYSKTRKRMEVVYSPLVVHNRKAARSQNASWPKPEYKLITVHEFNVVTSALKSVAGHFDGQIGCYEKGRYGAVNSLWKILLIVIGVYGPTAPWTAPEFVKFVKLWRRKGKATRKVFAETHVSGFDDLFTFFDRCTRRKPAGKIEKTLQVPKRFFRGLL